MAWLAGQEKQMSIRDDAEGHWVEILLTVGVDRSFLKNSHGPCPICGGRDRFRWDNRNNRGGFLCNHCGSGDGFKLAELHGMPFREVCDIIRSLGLSSDRQKAKADTSADDRAVSDRMAAIWRRAHHLERGCPTDKYLARRLGSFIDLSQVKCVKEVFDIWHPLDGKKYPAAMVCKVASGGRAVNLHFTYMDSDGVRIQSEKPKLVTAGAKLPPGCAVQLADHDDHLGIAEGVETSLACRLLTGIPTWAAVNASVLAQWEPPQTIKRVTIFADNDMSYTGQAKAYCLANRLVVKNKLSVDVKMPPTDGADWADIAMAGAR